MTAAPLVRAGGSPARLRWARVGGALIGLTMIGAIAIHIAVLDTGVGGAVIP